MKKILILVSFLTAFVLTGCLDTTEEIIMNEDGTGMISVTNDMSASIAMAKQMSGEEPDADEMEEPVDTTLSLANEAEKNPSLSDQEKEWVKKGTLRLIMNMKEDKMIIGMKFPFSNVNEIAGIRELSAKMMEKKMSNPDEGGMAIPGMEDAPEPSRFDDYYETNFGNGIIERKVNKEKYANAQNDEYLKSMLEMAGMGAPMMTTYIINLPKPATKAEGKSVKLSEDKKKVTVHVSVDDFFNAPESLEFRIEY